MISRIKQITLLCFSVLFIGYLAINTSSRIVYATTQIDEVERQLQRDIARLKQRQQDEERETVLILVCAQALIFAGFCSFVAGEKNRSQSSWWFLGLIFSIIALIALVGVPPLRKDVPPNHSGDG